MRKKGKNPMNMYFHELRALRKSSFIWAFALVALAALYLSLYPGVAKDVTAFKELISGYPPTVRALLGIDLERISTLLGFYPMVFSFIVLCGAVQSMQLGLSILAKEISERTADFLLVKPVSRSAIVTSKVFAALTMILVMDIVFFAALICLLQVIDVGVFDHQLFFLINVTLVFIQLIFFSLGLAISVFFRKLKAVLPITLGVVIGFYMLFALLGKDKGELFRFFSPFQYFDVDYILDHGTLEWPYLLATAVVFLVCLVISYLVFTSKDIDAI
jgi:ABC-2 type transport system permease protein